ncbi:MAG: glycosyltransferase [Sphaerochaeta sp.]|nr:glycosyltransferase [Sphaerochaeta sp.]
MKRIIYISSYSIIDNNQIGIITKLLAQCNQLSRYYAVTLLLIGDNPPVLCNNHMFIKAQENIKIDFIYVKREADSLKKIRERYRKATKLLKYLEMQKFDFIYMRYSLADPFFLQIYKKYGNKMITEHQTKEVHELFKNGHYIYAIIELFFGSVLLSKVSGIVACTNEILEYELNRALVHKNSLVNGNGINVESVKLKKNIFVEKNQIDIVCIASFAYWHGIDRLINGIHEYNGRKKIVLHLIGGGDGIADIQANINQDNCSIKIYGYKNSQEIDEIFDRFDLAICSLGIHRKGLLETSELKAREYCARGIPFITSSPDADFPRDFSYILKFQSNEDPIDINRIIDFYANLKADTYSSSTLRKYALENLDWKIKIEKLSVFINNTFSSI